jgi:hypothetical protein
MKPRLLFLFADGWDEAALAATTSSAGTRKSAAI